jgi:hypothetical protein
MLFNFDQSLIDSLKDPKTIISIVSAIISSISVYLTRRFWLSANRPIVSAYISTNSAGNVAIMYDLVVCNTGNRPATSVRLHVDKEVLESIINPDADQSLASDIYKCFSSDAVIPLLLNGKDTNNCFGSTSSNMAQNILKYNSEIPITISYSDLEKRHYCTNQILIIKTSQGFAGSRWKS